MIYTLEELRDFVAPIISTAVKADIDPDEKIKVTTNAIMKLIKQDREARADETQ